MKRIILAVLMLVGSTVALSEDWITLADNDSSRYDGRTGTATFGKTKSGTPIIVAQGRIFDKKTKAITFKKWYVSVNDCKAGYGKLVTLNMSNDFEYENDFVEKGGTMGSAVAEMLCFAVKEEIGKGI